MEPEQLKFNTCTKLQTKVWGINFKRVLPKLQKGGLWEKGWRAEAKRNACPGSPTRSHRKYLYQGGRRRYAIPRHSCSQEPKMERRYNFDGRNFGRRQSIWTRDPISFEYNGHGSTVSWQHRCQIQLYSEVMYSQSQQLSQVWEYCVRERWPD